MSYENLEESSDGANPVELYQIHYSGNSWFFTSADRDIVSNGITYTAVPCSHAEIEQQITGDKFGLEIVFPHDIEFGEIFRIQPPSEVVSMTILGENFTEPGTFVVIWKGRIVNNQWEYPWLKLITENIASSMKRVGLRRRYSVMCTHPLYGSKCSVPREVYRVNAVVSAINGYHLIIPSLIGMETGRFAGGLITWGNSGSSNQERRMVFSSDGATGGIVLTSLPIGLLVGQAIAIYPGCDHSITTCGSKFNNADNFGGMPYIPDVNPFAGTNIY